MEPKPCAPLPGSSWALFEQLKAHRAQQGYRARVGIHARIIHDPSFPMNTAGTRSQSAIQKKSSVLGRKTPRSVLAIGCGLARRADVSLVGPERGRVS